MKKATNTLNLQRSGAKAVRTATATIMVIGCCTVFAFAEGGDPIPCWQQA